MSTKKGFEFARNSIYVADPAELVIVGGKSLPPDERGHLDTEVDESHELHDERVDMPLAEETIANIDAYGVMVPILIAKVGDDGLAYVVDGRQRVRAARVVNARRKKRGEPPIKVDAKVRRATGESSLLGAMVSTNEVRVGDDVPTKIAKAKRMLARGVSVEDTAVSFGCSLSTLQQWLHYDDHAIPQVKAAVDSGRLSQSAGATIARLKDPDRQAEALQSISVAGADGKKPSLRAARTAVAKKKKPASSGGVVDKATQRRLLEAIEKMPHKNASAETLSWWQGVEDALKLVTGDDDLDARLVKVLDEVKP
jgi:ParB family chromosome partitioning protein